MLQLHDDSDKAGYDVLQFPFGLASDSSAFDASASRPRNPVVSIVMVQPDLSNMSNEIAAKKPVPTRWFLLEYVLLELKL